MGACPLISIWNYLATRDIAIFRSKGPSAAVARKHGTRMRLLMTTDTVGGVWTYTKDLTAELLKKGVAIALVTIGRVPSTAQSEWLKRTAAEWAGASLGSVRDATRVDEQQRTRLP